MQRVLNLLVATVLALIAAPAFAQTDFSSLQTAIGETVYVTAADGRASASGILKQVTPSLLVVDDRQVPFEQGIKVARRGDSLWNGFLIGAGIGVAAGVTIGAEACLDDPIWPCAVGGAAVWGGIGALIDWARKGRTVIFQAPGGQTILLKPSFGRRRSLDLAIVF